MAPIYKGNAAKFQPGATVATDIEIGGGDLFQSETFSPNAKRKELMIPSNYMLNELQDLQEQTAEDAEDLADDLINRSKGKKKQKSPE